jgi:transposase
VIVILKISKVTIGKMAQATADGRLMQVRPMRPTYEGPPIQVYTSFGKAPKVNEEGRKQICLDHSWLELALTKKRMTKELALTKKRMTKEKDELKARIRDLEKVNLELQEANEDPPDYPLNVPKRMRRSADSESEPMPAEIAVLDKRKGANKLIAEHYKLDKSTVRDIVRRAKKLGKTDSEKRAGAPKLLTAGVRKIAIQVFNEFQGRLNLKRWSAEISRRIEWNRTYKSISYCYI